MTAPMFIFVIVAVLAAAGDVRMMRAAAFRFHAPHSPAFVAHVFRDVGRRRVVLLGARGRVPEVSYYPALLPIPVLMPVVRHALLVLAHTRAKRSGRGIAGIAAPHTAAAAKV